MAQDHPIGRAERSLLARCRRLDTAALHAVLYRCADDVYERLAARLRDRDPAEQAFEEVFRRFLEESPAFNGSRTVLEHLLAITDAVAPPSDAPALAESIEDAEFVDLVPRAALVMRVERTILRDAPALARTASDASRRVRRQLVVASAGLLIAVAGVAGTRLGRVVATVSHDQVQLAAEAVIEGDLVEEVGEWIRREEHASSHGDTRRHDLEELRLVLEELASLRSSQRPVELTYIVERLRQRDLIDLAYELSEEAGSTAERRRILRIAELLEEVSAL